MAVEHGQTLNSETKRLFELLRHFGISTAISVAFAAIDERYLKSFDRKYRVKTSGHVELLNTSFDRSKLRNATSYGPVNARAFRGLLENLNFPKQFHFVDLGSGLGRACFLAAEYGFQTVTGVELAPELCQAARENIAACRMPSSAASRITIVQGDVLDYCERTDADVFFVYRAFSLDFFRATRKKLAETATRRNKGLILIYTERLGWPMTNEMQELSQDQLFRTIYQTTKYGQVFRVCRCEPRPA